MVGVLMSFNPFFSLVFLLLYILSNLGSGEMSSSLGIFLICLVYVGGLLVILLYITSIFSGGGSMVYTLFYFLVPVLLISPQTPGGEQLSNFQFRLEEGAPAFLILLFFMLVVLLILSNLLGEASSGPLRLN